MAARGVLRGAWLAILLAALWLATWCTPASATHSASWTLGLATGTAYNVPLTLRIEQAGEPALRMTARWATRPFRAPPYYAARIGWCAGQGGWELELIHHKLYLENSTAEVPHLEATHGYNYLLLNRVERRGRLVWRLGAGALIVHLEGVARGQPLRVGDGALGAGYRLTGPAAQFGVGRPIDVGRSVFVSPELRLTGAYASVPLEDGRIVLPNLAVHATVGVGFRL